MSDKPLTSSQKILNNVGNLSEVTKQSALTTADLASRAAENVKTAAVNVAKSTGQVASSTLSTAAQSINEYTPDIYDVGGNGTRDFTADGGAFITGNTAMVADNAIKMAKAPIKKGMEIVSDKWYNEKKLNKASTLQQSMQAKDPNLKLTKVEIATRHSSKPTFDYKDKLAFNRWNHNGINSVSQQAKLFKNQYKANKYDRLLKRKNFLKARAGNMKTFSLRSSTKGMLTNQYRKLSSMMIRGNDPNSMESKAFSYANNAMRYTYANRRIFKKMFKDAGNMIKGSVRTIFHPMQAIRRLASAIMSVLSSIIGIITSIPIVISIIVSVLPVIIMCIIMSLIVSTVLSWFAITRDSCQVYKDVKLCDLGNKVKDLANETAITAKNSEQYKLLFENKYGTVKHDDWGLAYIEDKGIKYYCNALATYYTSEIGSKWKVTLENGVVIYTITCDIKADQHTHAGNNDPSSNCLSGDGSMLEFYGQINNVTRPKLIKAGYGSIGNDLDEDHMWKAPVSKIEKMSDTKSCVAASKDYVKWMIEIASDNTHGYSQARRAGGVDYDCSSFVYFALLNNGMTKEQLSTYPFTTFSMGSILTGPAAGFKEYDYNDVKNDLQEGDILVSNLKGLEHTEVYIGNGMTVGAHAGDQDGRPGDSSGNEISIIPNSTHESLNGGNYWQHVYRPNPTKK